MSTAELKSKLYDKINNTNEQQLEKLYGLVLNYLNGQDDTEDEWNSLPAYQQERLIKSLEQADAGLITPVEDIICKMREQYGLNG